MTASPKTRMARDLIALLRSDDLISEFVLPTTFRKADQINRIKATTGKYGGCLAIMPGLLANPWPDDDRRDAYMTSQYVVLGFAHAKCTSRKPIDGIDTASDWLDALFAEVIGLITGWAPFVPGTAAIVQGEEPVEMPGNDFAETEVRGLIVRVPIYFPTITIQ